jgi:hypothetical protein
MWRCSLTLQAASPIPLREMEHKCTLGPASGATGDDMVVFTYQTPDGMSSMFGGYGTVASLNILIRIGTCCSSQWRSTC